MMDSLQTNIQARALTKVKVCGITNAEDALVVEAAGADAIGLIFVDWSKRYITVEQARAVVRVLGPFIHRVGVFIDADEGYMLELAQELQLSAIQLHGAEPLATVKRIKAHYKVIKAINIKAERDQAIDHAVLTEADAVFLDGVTPGSGQVFDWNLAKQFTHLPRLILAGGLKPDNVCAGIEALAPYAVDAASGVEQKGSPRRKDAAKVLDFVRLAKGLTTQGT